MSSRSVWWSVCVVAVVLGVLFRMFPDIDLTVSRFFFVPEEGFPWRSNWFLNFVHEGIYVFTALLSLLLLGLLAVYYATKRRYFGLSPVKLYYLIAVMIVGPGLLVNVVSKDNLWGRARPIQTVIFGGTQEFSPAFSIVDQCADNCSFVSGHASVGFYGFALAMIAVGSWRRRVWVGSMVMGLLTSAARVMEGAHFLSDVLFAGLLMYLLSVWMWERWFSRWDV